MNFKLVQAHKSLPAGLEWNNIPDFAIITGKNGTGKSHLLEVLKDQKNWEEKPFSYQNITYISAMHNFINTNSVTRSNCMEQRNHMSSEIFSIYKMLENSNIKEVIRSSNIDLLEMAKMPDSNGQYHEVIQRQLGSSFHSGKIHEINSILSNFSQHISYLTNILKSVQKNRIEDVTEDEFLNNIPIDNGNTFINTSNLKQWFIAYSDDYDKKSGIANRQKNNKAIEKLQNEIPPWKLMNEILINYEFDYTIADFNPDSTPIEIKFISNKDNRIVQIESLSSGEQQIISLVAWAHHEVISQNIKLLLLDEPDAHLHPSFCKIFINIMKEYIVEKHKIKVIMTTHSPSTIAYAPDESIFVMDSEEPRIQKQDKDTSLNILSDGLMTLQEGGQILNKINKDAKCVVFVEGTSDVTHFELACEKLNKQDLCLQFISGYGLERLVPFLKGCPYNLLFDKTVIGIFDNDKKGEESFNSFCREWELYNDQDSIKKKKGSDAYIMKLPLLDEHSLFCENTIELYYSKETLETQNMIDKRTLKEVNTRNDGNQMNDVDYSNKDNLEYYKLCSATKEKEKNDFANYCKALDKQEFENFKKIFSLIETIIN